MRRIATGLLFALGYTNAADKYILQYDNALWANLHLNSLPDNTIDVLQHVQMTVAELSADELSMYQNIPGITVHKDAPVELYGGVQEHPKNWGLDRIDQRELPLDQKFHYGTEGEGVDVYVVDTGVTAAHEEFGGRAVLEKNFAGDGIDRDCQGHGSHVASTIAGTNVGIAKKAKIHGVKVLNCQGSGTMANVIAGINYVVGTQTKNPSQKSVLNMSLGGGKNLAINAAVEAAYKAGVVVVVAAGNDGADACNYSPASAPDAITVAASDQLDKNAFFSNHGKCTDIYAPGVGIYGAWVPEGNDGYKSLQGTSMASPHVAGVATLILSSGQATTPADVKAKLLEVATKDVIKGIPSSQTPNKLLFADPAWSSSESSKAISSSVKTSFLSLNH